MTAETSSSSSPSNTNRLVDVGVNLSNAAFKHNWREVVQRAIDAGVDRLVLTGLDMASSRKCLDMAQTWLEETGQANLFVTVGVHPHHASQFSSHDGRTIEEMKFLLQHPLTKAVGECGLDYNRDYSKREDQKRAFREQVILASQLQMPLFLHERDAHHDFCQILNDIENDETVPPLPPVLVHCFTGTQQEAQFYIQKGFFLSFAGTICKHQRGASLRDIIPNLPLDRIMVETDAPFMGFRKDRRRSEPADTVGVAKKLAETASVSMEEACATTTQLAEAFFRLEGE